jgi:hypothetical protein
MSRKRYKPEEIVAKLRQVDVLTAQGTPVADAVRSIGVTEVASGRVAGWGDLLLTPRGADRHRELATSLQHGPPACLSGLPATGPGGVRASLRRMVWFEDGRTLPTVIDIAREAEAAKSGLVFAEWKARPWWRRLALTG